MLRPAPSEVFFKGRPGDTRLGEWVIPAHALPESETKHEGETWALFGCPDDTGVVRNKGRAGAALGPDSIRSVFYRLCPSMNVKWEERIRLFDFGNVVVSSEIRETHSRAFTTAKDLAQAGLSLIALGGGHDFAAPCFLGFCEGLANQDTKKSVGLINIDPHLDVRELENGLPHSGTPFRQILESGKILGKNFVEFGIRSSRNARDHYQFCLSHKVAIETLEGLKPSPVEKFSEHLDRLSKSLETIGVTFDMDSCSDAEGTSAAPVLGFSAWELIQMARIAGANRKVRYFEIAEVAPNLDPSHQSSRIAAEILYAFLESRGSENLFSVTKPKKKTATIKKNEKKRKK